VSGLTLYRLSADANTLVSLRPGKPNLPMHEPEDPLPPPPTSAPVLSRTGLTHNTATLSWTAVAGAAGYELRRGGTAVWSGTGLSRTDTGLNPLTDYTWTVVAFNDGGYGPASNEVSETTPSIPQPPADGETFLLTSAQIAEGRNRMSGAGPFYSTGQGFFGSQANAPGDGAAALSRANALLGNVTGPRYVQYVPIVANQDPWPNQSNTEVGLQPVAAAWCYRMMPDHPNRAAWRAAVKDLLLFTSGHPNHVFSDNSKYPVTFPGFAPSPIFAIADWMFRLLKMYDYLGRESFTASERTQIERMFYGAANYFVKWFDTATSMGSRVPGRLDFNFATNDMDLTGFWQQGAGYYRPYNGGPYVSAAGSWNNRTSSCVKASAEIAAYFKFYGISPPTSGVTQPSYGWFTIDQILHRTKVHAAEWLHFSVSPLGYCFDFHRGDTSPYLYLGWRYSFAEIGAMVGIAKSNARVGDDSVWTRTTTGGYNNTAGSPNNTPGVTGFPAKSLEFMLTAYEWYVNDHWGRRMTRGTVVNAYVAPPPGQAYRDVLLAAEGSKRFPSNSILSSAWRRSGNNMPGYPANPATADGQGIWNAYTGTAGTSVGLIEASL
jgi:hypothetical protein